MFKSYINKSGLRILLPEKIFQDIKSHVAKHYPKEFGGIFVGKIENENTAVIEKMMLPRKFKNNPIYFLRIADFINSWLSRIFKMSNGSVYYLGDWHSHPDGVPYPSSTDTASMKKISESSDIRIETPLLMIVGYNGKDYNEKFFIYSNNKLNEYKNEER